MTREILWEYGPLCCSHIPRSGWPLLMNRHSDGACVLVYSAQVFFREYKSCAGGEDEPELPFLCRAVESDALFWKWTPFVEKPCKRRLISMQMWGHKVVTTIWPALVSITQSGPRLGSAIYWEELGLWLNTVVGWHTCLLSASERVNSWFCKGCCAVLGRQGLCEDGSHESKVFSTVVWYNL